MKKLFLALLLVTSCQREAVVETPPPVEKTPPPASTTRPLEDSKTPPAVTGPKLAFVDEASMDPSFAAYRDQLLTAVRARDAKTVLALSDPSVRTSFGGGGGRADLEQALQEEVWGELGQILSLGGSFREGMFWAPYVYSTWPDAHDAFEHLAVIADDVPLHASADASAEAIATLSRDIVKRASQPGADRSAWRKVTTADGRTGFVEAKLARSPVGYRAGFMKTADGWRLGALVAGD